MEEKKEIEKNKETLRKEALNQIYSTIKQIKEKHKKEKEEEEETKAFSLKNYKIDKVLSDNKLKEVLQLMEPSIPTLNFEKVFRCSDTSKTTSRIPYSKYTALFNDISKYNEGKFQKPVKNDNNVFRKKVINVIKHSSNKTPLSQTRYKNNSVSNFTSIIKKSTQEDYINKSKPINKYNNIRLTFPKNWNSNTLKKYNSSFYNDKLDQFDKKLTNVSEYYYSALKKKQEKRNSSLLGNSHRNYNRSFQTKRPLFW